MLVDTVSSAVESSPLLGCGKKSYDVTDEKHCNKIKQFWFCTAFHHQYIHIGKLYFQEM